MEYFNLFLAIISLVYTYFSSKNSEVKQFDESVFDDNLRYVLPSLFHKFESKRTNETFNDLTAKLLHITDVSIIYKYLKPKKYEKIKNITSDLEDIITTIHTKDGSVETDRFAKGSEKVGELIRLVY